MGQVLVTYNDGSTATMDQGLAQQLVEDGGSSISNWTPVVNPKTPNGTVTSSYGVVTTLSDMANQPSPTPISNLQSNTAPSPTPSSSLGALTGEEQRVFDTVKANGGNGNQSVINLRAQNAGVGAISSGLAKDVTVTPSGDVSTVTTTPGVVNSGKASATDPGVITSVPVPKVTPPAPSDDYYAFTDSNNAEVRVSASQYESWSPMQQFTYQKSIGAIDPKSTIVLNKDGSWSYAKPSTAASTSSKDKSVLGRFTNDDGTIDIGAALASGVTPSYIQEHTQASNADIKLAQAINRVNSVLTPDKNNTYSDSDINAAVASGKLTQGDVDTVFGKQTAATTVSSGSSVNSGIVIGTGPAAPGEITWNDFKNDPTNKIPANATFVSYDPKTGSVNYNVPLIIVSSGPAAPGEITWSDYKSDPTNKIPANAVFTSFDPKTGTVNYNISQDVTASPATLSEINGITTNSQGNVSKGNIGKILALQNAIDSSGVTIPYTPAVNSKGLLVSADETTLAIWNKLSTSDQQTVANLYASNPYKKNGIAEIGSMVQQTSAQGGLVGQFVFSPITGISTPVAKSLSGQKVSGGEIAGAVVTGILDVLAVGGGVLGTMGETGKIITAGAEGTAAVINIPNVIAADINPNTSIGQKVLATGGEILLAGGAIYTALPDGTIAKIGDLVKSTAEKTANIVDSSGRVIGHVVGTDIEAVKDFMNKPSLPSEPDTIDTVYDNYPEGMGKGKLTTGFSEGPYKPSINARSTSVIPETATGEVSIQNLNSDLLTGKAEPMNGFNTGPSAPSLKDVSPSETTSAGGIIDTSTKGTYNEVLDRAIDNSIQKSTPEIISETTPLSKEASLAAYNDLHPKATLTMSQYNPTVNGNPVKFNVPSTYTSSEAPFPDNPKVDMTAGMLKNKSPLMPAPSSSLPGNEIIPDKPINLPAMPNIAKSMAKAGINTMSVALGSTVGKINYVKGLYTPAGASVTNPVAHLTAPGLPIANQAKEVSGDAYVTQEQAQMNAIVITALAGKTIKASAGKVTAKPVPLAEMVSSVTRAPTLDKLTITRISDDMKRAGYTIVTDSTTGQSTTLSKQDIQTIVTAVSKSATVAKVAYSQVQVKNQTQKQVVQNLQNVQKVANNAIQNSIQVSVTQNANVTHRQVVNNVIAALQQQVQNQVQNQVQQQVVQQVQQQQQNQTQTTQNNQRTQTTQNNQRTQTQTNNQTQKQQQTQQNTQNEQQETNQTENTVTSEAKVKVAPPVITPTVPDEEGKTKKKSVPKDAFGTVTWKQGFGWYARWYPYRQQDSVFVKNQPKGATQIANAKSAYDTIQTLTGMPPDKVPQFNMGIEEVGISAPPHNPTVQNRASISFQRNSKARGARRGKPNDLGAGIVETRTKQGIKRHLRLT